MFWIWFVVVLGLVSLVAYGYDRKHRGHVRARTGTRAMEGSVGAGDPRLNYGQADVTPPITGDPQR